MQAQQQIDWDNPPPEHPVCEVQVEVPTVRFQERGLGYPDCPPEFAGKKEIVVQWFGDNSNGKLKARNLQFAFPVMSKPDSVQWFGHPEWFRVAYFGPLEHWPNPAAIPMFEQQGIKKGTIVLYVLSAQIGLDDSKGGTVPSSFVTTIALFGDPCVGVISPCEYKTWPCATRKWPNWRSFESARIVQIKPAEDKTSAGIFILNNHFTLT